MDEGEKAWLLSKADPLVYPTVQEGFGLVPFEAADAGVATLWAAHSSLAEVLPPEAAAILPWDVRATAQRAAALLRDPAAREAIVAAVREAAGRFTWDRTAAGILAVYREAAVAPARQAVQGLDGMPDVALSLVGPKGYARPRRAAGPRWRSLLARPCGTCSSRCCAAATAPYRARRLPVRNTRQPR